MPFKVEVGPPQISIHQGQTVLVSDPDGQITWPSDKGLYFLDTRVVSAWAIYANGAPWELLNGGAINYDNARIYLTNKPFLTENATIEPRTLAMVLSRALDRGLHEDIDITNHGMTPLRFNLEIAVRSDFADIFEVKSNRIVRRGRIATEWSESAQRLRTTYTNGDFVRSVTIHPKHDGASAVYANGRLSFDIALAPGETWHTCLLYDLSDGPRHFAAPPNCFDDAQNSQHRRSSREWQDRVLQIRTSNEEFYRLYRQGIEDMAALRLPIEGTDHMVFLPAAGLPWFVAPFGRDSLIVSLQNLMIYPDFARGALDVLGRYQATERDDWRDAEPGKILHEIRYGELAHFKLIPHTPYYGTADATMLYLIVLHAAWRATGDTSLLEKHLHNAEACLTWIDDYGDRDGDGFQEYQTRSSAGYENMAWKDSGDSVTYLDGTLVKGPKALCELQGYVYDSWQRMAEVFDALGKPDRAETLRGKARALFDKFNAVFWDEEAGFYAYALDGDKKKVMSVASNPGHLLFSGIVPRDRAARVVARLTAPDMDSGWGIRTLTSLHPKYNPYSYPNGSVWPHDNAIIAMGFKRYGFHEEANRIARAISGAASYFLSNQLPELYAGIQRETHNFPVQYIGANVPQAWAAGSPFALMQTILGVRPDAPNGRVYVDPTLPDWLPDLELHGLHVGEHHFTIRFWRDGPETRFEVLKGDKAAVLHRSFASGPALRVD
jgi:glycogen debranching enzyme